MTGTRWSSATRTALQGANAKCGAGGSRSNNSVRCTDESIALAEGTDQDAHDRAVAHCQHNEDPISPLILGGLGADEHGRRDDLRSGHQRGNAGERK